MQVFSMKSIILYNIIKIYKVIQHQIDFYIKELFKNLLISKKIKAKNINNEFNKYLIHDIMYIIKFQIFLKAREI